MLRLHQLVSNSRLTECHPLKARARYTIFRYIIVRLLCLDTVGPNDKGNVHNHVWRLGKGQCIFSRKRDLVAVTVGNKQWQQAGGQHAQPPSPLTCGATSVMHCNPHAEPRAERARAHLATIARCLPSTVPGGG